MAKNVRWSEPGKVQLRGIDQSMALRILRTLARYALTGEGDVQRLQGIEPPEFRSRCGDSRVRIYDYSDSIVVLSVKHRRAAYR
jgi:mRNA-degrading endonuclease RelE of RelBE toxin-antitoxin system